MSIHIPEHGGFIKIILIVVIALIVLGYFGLNIGDILASPVVKENLAWFWDFLTNVWTTYLSGPAHWLWDNLIRVLWDLFIEGVGNIKANSGQAPMELPSI